MAKRIKSDIDIFTSKMGCFAKNINNGIEVRTKQDIDIAINEAKAIISSLDLRLHVVSNGYMSSRNAFEVKNKL